MGAIIFIAFIILLIFPELLLIPVLILIIFFEFILRLFGKSFDDSPTQKVKNRMKKRFSNED